MPDPQLYQSFARYNSWMNEKVYAAAGRLDEASRREDRGAFFGSIQGTLSHILWGDIVWLGRFGATDRAKPASMVDFHESFEALTEDRKGMDRLITRWVEGLDQAWLDSDLTWVSGMDNKARTHPGWLLLSHMFNHQTHHRGQVTTLLTQLGEDVGSTDLPWVPADFTPG